MSECHFRVIELQRRARAMLCRKYQGEFRSARLAAIVLQAGARRMFARTQLSSLKSASLRLLREYNRQQTVRAKAVLQLQTAARVFSARRKRASLAEERDSRLDLAKRERQAKAQAKEVSRAATRVQSSWRRIQAGRQLCVLQEEAKQKKEIALAARRERAHKAVQRSSAVRLQCMWRSITAVQRLNRLREEAREASVAAARRRARAAEVAAQRLRRAEAAVIIQAAVRGLIDRRSSRLRFMKLAEDRAALLSEARRQMTLRVASTTFLLGTHASTGAAEAAACMAAMRLQARWRALILKRREYAVRESEEKARAAERAAIEQKEAMAAVFSDMEHGDKIKVK
ncbi:hypothetical protein AB1Y20_001933 [Prymnesium parvum]|uniref:Uncharacterized protein n=1 Tax=Prymnesium parvum TaxID=97485 RepID=A0AB34J9I7_PRYPA